MSDQTALIGYTGFVGGNINRQHKFDVLYNTKNINDLGGNHYQLVVSAGAPAEKWRANQDPLTDRAALDRLKGPLSESDIDQLVLISTVDVYPIPVGVDETSQIDPTKNSAYGKHRYELEQFCQQHFKTLIVRLPGLFGQGLKKNVIYDFMHDNNVELINADSVFQFYNLDRIWSDISTALEAGLDVVNLATEPVSVAEVARAGFGRDFTNRPADRPAVRYDFRTVYAEEFGGTNGYISSKAQVLEDIAKFVGMEMAK